MSKQGNKTTTNDVDPRDFVASVEHPTRRADAERLLELFGRVTGMTARMWGPTIVGYGSYHYTYESGREGDMLMTGFSPRKANLVLYVLPGYDDLSEPLSRLGKHRIGKSCLYVNKLDDIDLAVLEEILVHGLEGVRARWPTDET